MTEFLNSIENFMFNVNEPTLTEDKNTNWCVVSQVVGWIYFAAWSVSFYGQIYENWKHKHIKGLALDYQLYNFTGFLGYSIYNLWGYIDPAIGVTIQIQDVLFACHAFLATLITIGQVFLYRDKEDPSQTVSHTSISITICIWWGFFVVILIEQILHLYDPYHPPKDTKFAFNSIFYLGWMKAFISFIKYLPQVLLNIKRKSTKGWSIFNILLDFTGGSFSFIQNIIDSIYGCGKVISGDGGLLYLNIVKYAISVMSMIFDIIFMIQHYIIYKNPPEESALENRLINQSDYSDKSKK